MSLSLKMDLARYRNDMNRFVGELGANGRELLKEEMRLLLRDIQRFTPPKSLAQGRNAVQSDLRRNAAPLDWKNIKMPRLAEAVYRKDIPAINAITAKLGGWFKGRKLLTDLNAIKEAHLKNRNRYGRVRGDKHNMAFLGDWTKYLRTIQSRVGWTRAGWWRAAQAVGLPLPNWIAKHRSYAPSGYFAPRPGDMSITAINRSVKIPDYENRHVVPAVRARVKSLASELARLLKGGKSRRGSLSGTALSE